MSLPTSKPAQSSIRSFFQAQQPKYAPPPSQKNTINNIATPPPPASNNASLASPPPTAPTPSPAYAPPTLPSEASIRPITDPDIAPLRRINALLLPVSYSDAFYRRITDPSSPCSSLSRVITWAHEGEEPKVVGGVVCTVEPAVEGQKTPQNLYIQSLCLLAPYRSLGLASFAVDGIIAAALADGALDVRTVSAHVWTHNEEGLRWYAANGFKQLESPIRGYYLKLRPDSAVIVRRDVSASVRPSLPPSTSATSQSPQPARPVASSITAAVVNLPPPPTNGASNPPRPGPPSRVSTGQSYQNQRAETEWNDLPADMAGGLLAPPPKTGSEPTSGASSRSSSTARKKRDRSYPAAAFGG